MSPNEVNAVLTYAALFDPRMKRTDELEQADMAMAWAAAIPAGVTVDAARAAVEQHYRSERDSIMLADLVALAGVDVAESVYVDRTTEVLEAQMLRDLAELGTTPAEYRSDRAVRARVDAALDARHIEKGLA